MTTQEKVESLIQEAVELPDEVQVELLQSLIEARAEHLGIYHIDDKTQHDA